MKMLSPVEVAERLNVSYDTALSMIKYSGLPYLKIGRQYRISEDVLNDLMTQEAPVSITFDVA